MTPRDYLTEQGYIPLPEYDPSVLDVVRVDGTPAFSIPATEFDGIKPNDIIEKVLKPRVLLDKGL